MEVPSGTAALSLPLSPSSPPPLSTPTQNAVKKLEDNKDMQKIRSQIEYWKAQAGVPETNERLMDWAGYEEIEEEREEKEGGGVGS